MKEFADVISSYRIVNNLIPGGALCVFSYYFIDNRVLFNNVFFNICLFYIVGIVIGRIGSVIVEKVCKDVGFIDRAKYEDFVEAEKSDTSLKTISEISDLYRNMISLCILLEIGCAISLCFNKQSLCLVETALLISVIVGALMLFAYKKQINYVRRRVYKDLDLKKREG